MIIGQALNNKQTKIINANQPTKLLSHIKMSLKLDNCSALAVFMESYANEQ